MNEVANSIGRQFRQGAREVSQSRGEVLPGAKSWTIRRFNLDFERAQIYSGLQAENQLSSPLPSRACMNDATAMLAAIRSGDSQATEQFLVLGSSLSTVKNYWAFSRAWLLNEIETE